MKKFIKYLIINLIIIFSLFCIVEYVSVRSIDKRFFVETKFSDYVNIWVSSVSVEDYFYGLYNDITYAGVMVKKFRETQNIENIEKYSPILFMGCSFTYGDCLEENETVSYKFAKYSGKPVYNRAGSAWGLSQMLYQLSGDLLYNNIQKEPEYLIYIYIHDHIFRLDKFKPLPYTTDFQPKYKFKNNVLLYETPHFYDKFHFIENIQFFYQYILDKDRTDEVVQYFLQAEDEMRKHWKNTKFVIIKYPIAGEYGDILVNDPIFRKLKETGKFTILSAKDLTSLDLLDNKNKVADGWHPAAHVWDDIVPNLAKVLGIKKCKNQL